MARRSVAELPVFDGGNYPASVIAIQNTVLLHGLCLAHPEVALKFLRVVGARLRRKDMWLKGSGKCVPKK